MGIRTWITGARIRTLPLALAPIFLGSSTAATLDRFDLTLSVLALLVALLLQIAVNYANDYSDGIRGTDSDRVGPQRITAGGLARPAAVKRAAFLSFGLAALAGGSIVLITQQWWLFAIGLLAIIAAWFYTGGKQPYGYHGLGEVAVFIFFGLVATIGTNYIQTQIFDSLAVLLGCSFGLYASAVLLVNNIRDLETDRAAGKRTLAVLLGQRASRRLFLLIIWLPVLVNVSLIFIYPATVIGLLNLLLLLPITLIVRQSTSAKDLITALKLTSFAGLGFATLVSLGVYWVNFF